MSWATFLKSHWSAIAATNFFSVLVPTRRGLIRCFVLFVIDLPTRQVKIAGIVRQPDWQWMPQNARNLSDVHDGSLNECRYLIHHRDPLFAEAFNALLRSAGVKTVKLPARSPNLNAYAKRFVRCIKSECLGQLIPLGEHHLRKAVVEYTKHYHFERNHQGLDNRLITKPRDAPHLTRAVECRKRLGGILNYYYRVAA
jgi:putative transposase